MVRVFTVKGQRKAILRDTPQHKAIAKQYIGCRVRVRVRDVVGQEALFSQDGILTGVDDTYVPYSVTVASPIKGLLPLVVRTNNILFEESDLVPFACATYNLFQDSGKAWMDVNPAPLVTVGLNPLDALLRMLVPFYTGSFTPPQGESLVYFYKRPVLLLKQHAPVFAWDNDFPARLPPALFYFYGLHPRTHSVLVYSPFHPGVVVSMDHSRLFDPSLLGKPRREWPTAAPGTEI